MLDVIDIFNKYDIEKDEACEYLKQNKEKLTLKALRTKACRLCYVTTKAAMLLYYLSDKRPSLMRDNPVLPEDMMNEIYADLGISYIQE